MVTYLRIEFFFLLELANTNESNEKIKYLKLKINK